MMAGCSINKPQWKSPVSAVAHLTVSSSASVRDRVQLIQAELRNRRAQKSQLKIKNIDMYVPYHLPF